MKQNMNPVKKRLLRRRILEHARDMYLHPQTDSMIAENLKSAHPSITTAQVREMFGYLARKGLVTEHGGGNSPSVRITPEGIDALDGALSVRGVEPADGGLNRLGYKKEIRRGILRYCHTFAEFFNEDTEIHRDFRSAGFSNLLLEEVRFHMWYLGRKSYLELKSVNVAGDLVFMARISVRGIDILENSETDKGVSHDVG